MGEYDLFITYTKLWIDKLLTKIPRDTKFKSLPWVNIISKIDQGKKSSSSWAQLQREEKKHNVFATRHHRKSIRMYEGSSDVRMMFRGYEGYKDV